MYVPSIVRRFYIRDHDFYNTSIILKVNYLQTDIVSIVDVRFTITTCGVHPFDPEIIPEEAFTPSTIRIIEMDESGTSVAPAFDANSSNCTTNSYSEVTKTPEIKKKAARKQR